MTFDVMTPTASKASFYHRATWTLNEDSNLQSVQAVQRSQTEDYLLGRARIDLPAKPMHTRQWAMQNIYAAASLG